MKTKSIKLSIIILLMVIIILGGVFAYLYFATDVFKTNQQLFFKYLGQLGAREEGFVEDNLTAYFEKKRTGKYEDNGTYSVDIDMSGIDDELLATVNDFNIEYSGQIDNTTRKSEQDISINYSNDVKFPIKYKYANETLGLQTDYVSSKYIGIENSNLKEFAESLGITDTEGIPDSIDFYAESENESPFNFTEEEKQQIINTYKTIIEEKLANKEFGKTEENGVTNYSVEITNQEAKDMMISCLETLKTDNIILPKIEEALAETLEIANQSSTEEITIQDVIQAYIDELNQANIEDGSSVIIVSQTNRKLTGITVQIEGIEFKITKTNEQDTLAYTMEINMKNTESGDNIRCYVTASYQGLEQLASVNETYQFGITGTMDGAEQKMVYNLNCTDTFKDDINIEDFEEDDIQVINEYNGEQIAVLMTTIGERIQEVNAMQMEQIGFTEYGNPMLYAFPIVSLNMLIHNQAREVIDDTNLEQWADTVENGVNDDSLNENNDSNPSAEEMMNGLQQSENSLTNATLEQYAGENRGSIVRDLLLYVSTTNQSRADDEKIVVTGDIQMSGTDTEVPSDIDVNATYNVELTYDTNQNVNGIMITKR